MRGAVELFERNTALGFLPGYGRDRVEPVEVFGGQEALWPAGHHRWAASASLTQLLSPRWLLRAGLGATWQRGTLSSPYRRALVRPNLLLPEALPRARDRYTGFVGPVVLDLPGAGPAPEPGRATSTAGRCAP